MRRPGKENGEVMQQRTEYRFPAVWWNTQQQRWVTSSNTISLRGVVIDHQQIDPGQLPAPRYVPGQHVTFLDAHRQRHQGMITRVGSYGCTYHHPSERDYWYQWCYLGRQSYSYVVRTNDGALYQLFADAIVRVVSSTH